MFVIQRETKTFFTKKKKILYVGPLHNKVKRVEDALKFNSEHHANNHRRIHSLDRSIWKVRRI